MAEQTAVALLIFLIYPSNDPSRDKTGIQMIERIATALANNL